MVPSWGEQTVPVIPRCERCSDVIGIYEPLVHVHVGIVRRTSRAKEPDIGALSGVFYHGNCYDADPLG
jgi:hypothetical protein